ncbi:MAG: hypothetical protein V4694_05065 [Pseudomonadota bacterium]
MIFKLLRNPIIKIIGISIILYYGLFANKEKPGSLGNRFSSEQIKKDFSEVREKTVFIAANVKLAREIAKEKEAEKKAAATNPALQISVKDLEEGDGETISCGDSAYINYGIYTKDGRQLEFKENQILVIGNKSNWLLEKNIIGMKQAGSRYINIPQGSQVNDAKITEYLKSNKSDLKYQVTLLAFTKNANPQFSCN